MDIFSFPCSKIILYLASRQYSTHLTPFPCHKYFSHVFLAKKFITTCLHFLRFGAILKQKNTTYMKDLLKEWLSGRLTSCGWYLNYPADNTPKSKCGLKEKFEDAHLNKPPSIDFNFRVGKGAIVPRN